MRSFGGAAEILSAVAESGLRDSREVVRTLYGFDVFAKSTMKVYQEMV